MGFTALLNVTCVDTKQPWDLGLAGADWQIYSNPIVLLVFYFYTLFQLRLTYAGSGFRDHGDLRDDVSSIHEEVSFFVWNFAEFA